MMPALLHLRFNVQACDDGKVLIVAKSYAGQLFTFDPATGVATPINLGSVYVIVYADGLVAVCACVRYMS